MNAGLSRIGRCARYHQAFQDVTTRSNAVLERPTALARLAHRYLTGHGPADARDLAEWAGITISDARTAMAGIADELVERADGLVDPADRLPTPPIPSP